MIRSGALIIFFLLLVSCDKNPGTRSQVASDDEARKTILGTWEQNDFVYGGKFMLVFKVTGLYQELYRNSSGSTSLLQDSLKYEIQNGHIDLPHDRIGPRPHKILQLDQKIFTYERASTSSDVEHLSYNRSR